MDNQIKWTDEILHGIESLPIAGTPGTIVVYGHQAAPILTSADPSEIIIAAAELGKGRVIVFSHDNYFHQFKNNDDSQYKQLNINLKSWLCHGKEKEVTIVSLENELSIPDNNSAIFLWRGAGMKSQSFYADLLSFVRNGGGLLLAMTPWGYLQIYGGSLTDMPMYNILKEIGICYTESSYNGPNPLPVQKNCAHLAHLAVLLSKDMSHLDQSTCRVIKQALCYLPKNAMEPFMATFHSIPVESCYPSAITPCKGINQMKLSVYLAMLRMKDKCEKALGCEDFPGECNPDVSLQTASVEVFSEKDNFVPTGYYLPAGVSMTVTVVVLAAARDPNEWNIRIGAHSDDISSHDEWKRWPSICTTTPLGRTPTVLSSHYGGLVYLSGPKNNTKISLKMENVVKAPYYNLCDSASVAEWTTRRCCTAPWTDLVGKNIILTLPSQVVRDVDPKEALEFWDTVVQAHYDLRGVDLGHQWFVPDIQPSAGYMHAGYPIVTHMDVADPSNEHWFLNVKGLRKTGSWGHFHELGHNLQSGSWTFDGTVEVTCNIFTLHAMDTVCNIKPWIHTWLEGQLGSAKNYLSTNSPFSTWQNNPGIGLFIYAQLARDFGWNAYRRVFREYEQLSEEEKPETLQQKIDQWIVRFSNAVDRNLIPLFEFWGFPISVETGSFVNFLKAYLPDDEITRYVSKKVCDILKRYPDIERSGNII